MYIECRVSLFSYNQDIVGPDNDLSWLCMHFLKAFRKEIPIPSNLRGAVLGVALRAPHNERAVCVSFGSLGLSKTLARVFEKVSPCTFSGLTLSRIQ